MDCLLNSAIQCNDTIMFRYKNFLIERKAMLQKAHKIMVNYNNSMNISVKQLLLLLSELGTFGIF